ncbi:hypothetical protein HDE_13215 [Halotydeus destructor]|nr:hypothetical protein HDE_13215 [Halotydeus destructor]
MLFLNPPKNHKHLPPDPVWLSELEHKLFKENRKSAKKRLKKLQLKSQFLNAKQNLYTSMETKLPIVISELKARKASLEAQVAALEVRRHDGFRCIRDNLINKLNEVSNLYRQRSEFLDYSQRLMRNEMTFLSRLPSVDCIDTGTQSDADLSLKTGKSLS